MATHLSEEFAGACVDAGGSAIGMPQLCPDFIPNQVFWLVVTLVVIFLILSRVALPRIGGILAQRAGTITNFVGEAEELKLHAQEADAAYDKALADARTQANKIVADAKADIQAELDSELAKADAEIAARTAESEKAIAEIRDEMVESVTAVARDTAGEIVTAMGGSADQATIDAAVAARIEGTA